MMCLKRPMRKRLINSIYLPLLFTQFMIFFQPSILVHIFMLCCHIFGSYYFYFFTVRFGKGTSPIPDQFKMRTFAEVTRNREDGRENNLHQFTKETRSRLMAFMSVPQSLSPSTTYSKGRTQESISGRSN